MPTRRQLRKLRREWRRRADEEFRQWAYGPIPSMFSTASDIPPWPNYFSGASGVMVDRSSAFGLSTAHACVRLTSDTLATTPLLVYQGEDPAERTRARDSWQWDRLHNRPNDQTSAFEFWSDVGSSVEATGDAFIEKVKTARRPSSADELQLFPLDPATVQVGREGGRRAYKITGRRATFDSSTILHIRGWSFIPGSDRGMSPIALHRELIGGALAREAFEERYFANDASPGIVLNFPGPVPDGELESMLAYWKSRHQGPWNAGEPAALTRGGTVQTFPINLKDAQFIEAHRYSGEEVARMFRVSALSLLGLPATADVDAELHRFLQVDMAPRYEQVRSALNADTDLFPSGSELFCEFLPDALLRPDIQARFAAYKDALQAGFMEPNEIRERENLPAHPDGAGLQKTPVGGAPNPPSNGKVEAALVQPIGGPSNGNR